MSKTNKEKDDDGFSDYCFSVVFWVFFITGICFFLKGCNPMVSDKCYRYDIVDGYIFGSSIQERTCTKCAKWKGGVCHRRKHWTCWDAYVYAYDTDKPFNVGSGQYGVWNVDENGNVNPIKNENGTNGILSCFHKIANGKETRREASKLIKQYPLSKHVVWFKQKHDSHDSCRIDGHIENNWKVGVILLSLDGFFVVFASVCLCLCSYCSVKSVKYDKQYVSPCVQPNAKPKQTQKEELNESFVYIL